MGWDELFHDLIVTSERGYREYWVGYFFLAKATNLLSLVNCCCYLLRVAASCLCCNFQTRDTHLSLCKNILIF